VVGFPRTHIEASFYGNDTTSSNIRQGIGSRCRSTSGGSSSPSSTPVQKAQRQALKDLARDQNRLAEVISQQQESINALQSRFWPWRTADC